MAVAFKETNFVIFFLLVIGLQECVAEKTIEVKLPTDVSPGDNVLLQCIFDVDNEVFSSVKWTKGGQEFFRYTENESPKIQLFQVAGIQVQENVSSLHEVQLINVSTETAGTYTCHVSTEESGILTSRDLNIAAKNNIEVKLNSPASAGDNVLLQCLFTINNKAVSSVKWFKSNQEFFRYTENASPKVQMFEVRGIHVQVQVQENNNSIHEVQLIDVSPETGGIYSCEVSTDDTTLLAFQTLDVTPKNTIEVIVPSPANPGDSVRLQCLYQFKKGVVSTLKWHKSNQEFFRYTAKDSTQIQLFEVPGVQVQTNNSSLHEVQLINVSTETGGLYICEVSADDTTLLTSRTLEITAPPAKLTIPEKISKISNEVFPNTHRLLNQGLTFLRP